MVGKLLLSISLVLVAHLALAEGSVSSAISKMGDTVHVEFQGLNQWDYQIQRSKDKQSEFIEVSIPGLDEKSKKELLQWKNDQISAVEINSKGPDGKNLLRFRLKNKAIEAFDYLTDQPSRLIVDFFPGEKNGEKAIENSATKSEKSAAKTSVAKSSAKAGVDDVNQVGKKLPAKNTDKDRKPATTDVLVIADNQKEEALSKEGFANLIQSEKKMGIFDGGDPNFSRFGIADYEIKEDAIVASRENVFIEFPMLKIETGLLPLINARKPIYEIDPKDTDENKQARLLLTLFENKRYHVFLKTLDWFYKKYPETQYDEILRFMWADNLFSLWLEERDLKDFDLAMLRYRQAIEKYPQSGLVERTQLLMGFATMDRGDYMGTLRLFQNHLQTRPTSPNRDGARLAVAESYLKLNRYDEAYQAYDDVEKDAALPKNKMTAAYLKGDVFHQKKDYQRAISEYQRAMKTYPDGLSEYPNAWFNQAGAMFWNGQFKDSLTTHIEFLKRFPNHQFAGYAMTRIAELLEILGADKTRVMGVYLETYFRYGETPSAIVARLRMLSARMNTMKEKEVEKAVRDISELAKKSDLPKIEQFATIMIADGFSLRQEFDKSLDLLVKYYQGHPTTADTLLLANRIVKNINQKIKYQVDKGDFISALRTHEKYADNWLKGTFRIDTKYHVGRAFELAGVFTEADKLYKDSLNKILSIRGTKAEKERNVFEKLPSTDEIYLRLASTSVVQNNFSLAYDYLKQIRDPEKLSEPQQIERVQLGSTLLDKKGDSESAVRYLLELIKSWKGMPNLVASPYLSLGELELKMGRAPDALESFRKVDELMQDSGGVSETVHSKALEHMSDIYLEMKKPEEAARVLAGLLERYEKKKPLDSIRYRMGKIFFDEGQVQKAATAWSPLKDRANSFWNRLAQEQLTGAQWSDDYQKYTKRIPAMAEKSELGNSTNKDAKGVSK